MKKKMMIKEKNELMKWANFLHAHTNSGKLNVIVL